MTNINITAISDACDKLAHRITKVEGLHHGSAWMFDQVMRAFSFNPAITSVNFTVFFNAPLMCEGMATIDRQGNLTCIKF